MLRDYQTEIVTKVLSLSDNTLIQADTGAGKTRILAVIAKQYTHVLLVAHRNLLIAQLSLEFAKAGVYHRMIASQATTRRAETLHRRNLGKSLIAKKANRFVCSIDTVVEYVDLEDCTNADDVKAIINNAIDFDDLNNLDD